MSPRGNQLSIKIPSRFIKDSPFPPPPPPSPTEQRYPSFPFGGEVGTKSISQHHSHGAVYRWFASGMDRRGMYYGG
ncbi:hypothetical protein P167DRAFT_578016 [Morchella conica CCBAS932]|uniref:Uncharacterized protein n=1 Tax=Morchella conica CCBAS932 TaxID=1392247 RepID=A0A3N4KDM2_9PEZI|nr:hypothetical protein P167DRAFT_578016 [Morchella conica CCBAS932]